MRVDVAIWSAICADDLRDWLPERRAQRTARAWLAHIDELKGDSAVRDIQNLPTTAICTPRT